MYSVEAIQQMKKDKLKTRQPVNQSKSRGSGSHADQSNMMWYFAKEKEKAIKMLHLLTLSVWKSQKARKEGK